MDGRRKMVLGRIVFLALMAVALTLAGGCRKAPPSPVKPEPGAALPEAARKAIEEEFHGAAILSVKPDDLLGLAIYEAEIEGTPRVVVQVSADGVIAGVETTVTDTQSIPEAVRKAIAQAADGGIATRYEKVDVRAEAREGDGALKLIKLDKFKTAYEAELSKGDQQAEVTVATDGTVLQRVKWEKKPSPPSPK
jgi:hypothetical protein